MVLLGERYCKSMLKPIKKVKDTNRIAKVNSLIEKELGPILHEFLDWQKGLITISKVETSRDMKYAKIWISIFYPSPRPSHPPLADGTPSPVNASGRGERSLKSLDDAKILDFLSKNIYDVQGELNKNFHTKIIPRISFHLDTSPRYVEHIDELIREVHKND